MARQRRRSISTRHTGRLAGLARPWLLLSVSGLVVLLGASAWIVYGSPAFGLTRIEVHGTTFMEVDDVRKAVAVDEGTSLAAIDAGAVARRVAELPAVKTVTVSRNWPHTIIVDVTERKPFLSVEKGKSILLVDESGVPFRTVEAADPETIIAVLSDPGRSDDATRAVLAVVSSLTPELREQLVKVDGSGADRISLELKNNRVVFWGDSSHSDRKAEVATVLLNRSGNHLDVSAPDVPTVS